MHQAHHLFALISIGTRFSVRDWASIFFFQILQLIIAANQVVNPSPLPSFANTRDKSM
jgi:hypothetical protein